MECILKERSALPVQTFQALLWRCAGFMRSKKMFGERNLSVTQVESQFCQIFIHYVFSVELGE